MSTKTSPRRTARQIHKQVLRCDEALAPLLPAGKLSGDGKRKSGSSGASRPSERGRRL
jgi:hypothetical protein